MTDDQVFNLIEKDVFEFDEVSRFAGAGFTDNLQNMLSRDKTSPGIKISEEDDRLVINLEIIVYFGVNIPQLCYDIQSKIKNDLENNAGGLIPCFLDKGDILKREIIREKTMQLIYQMDITGDFNVSDLSVVEESANVVDKKQAAATLEAVQEHHEEIDKKIEDNLDNWKFERIAKAELAILRTAVAEMLYVESIPVSVSINEAVELAKKYGDERSYKFVNSVLGKVAKSI